MFGLRARRHFINLGKFTGAGAAVELINRFLGEILPSGDIDGLEPTSFAPAPTSACRHPHLLQPSRQADDCRAGVRIRFAVRFDFHTAHLAVRPAGVGVSRTQDLN